MNLYPDSAQLLSLCRAGDSAAVETLVRTFKTPLYRLALSLLDDPAEADEATQDAFVAAIAKLASFRGESNFKTWLYAITLNVCRGRLRKRHARERLSRVLRSLFYLRGEEVRPEQVLIQKETSTVLWCAINALGENEREVIVLRYYHELSLNDIAQVVGVSERTIRTRLHDAHERMRVLLKGEVEFQ